MLLNGHLDTVGVGAMADPFAATVVGDRRTGRMYGRGTCDMKAGVAAMVCAAEAWASAVDAGSAAAGVGALTLVLSADEEDASAGTDAVIAELRRARRAARRLHRGRADLARPRRRRTAASR